MTVDLSQFVGKEVVVTLDSGEEFTTTIKKDKNKTPFSYHINHPSRDNITYTNSGLTDTYMYPNIVEIKPQHTTTNPDLEYETLKGIQECLAPEAIKYIESHDKYAELMCELLASFMKEKFGNIKSDVQCQITCMFMDSISLRQCD